MARIVDMVKSLFEKNFIYKIFGFVFIISVLLKLFSLPVFASSSRSDLAYYGDYTNQFSAIELIYTNNVITGYYEYHYNLDPSTFFFVYIPDHQANFVSYKVYVSTKLQFAFTEQKKSYWFDSDGTYGQFFLFDEISCVNRIFGMVSSSYFDYNGVRYYYYLQGITNSGTNVNNTTSQWTYLDCPCICSNTLLGACKSYIDGVNVWYQDQKGGAVNANVQVDTSNIEGILQHNLQYNSSTAINTQDIKDFLESSSSSTVLGEEEKLLLKRYDIWLIMLLFFVAFFVVRASLHQTGRNIRGR